MKSYFFKTPLDYNRYDYEKTYDNLVQKYFLFLESKNEELTSERVILEQQESPDFTIIAEYPSDNKKMIFIQNMEDGTSRFTTFSKLSFYSYIENKENFHEVNFNQNKHDLFHKINNLKNVSAQFSMNGELVSKSDIEKEDTKRKIFDKI